MTDGLPFVIALAAMFVVVFVVWIVRERALERDARERLLEDRRRDLRARAGENLEP